VGLEPVGKVPELKAASMDSLGKYFSSIEHSLFSVLNFSFFRTLSMKTDLKESGVNGTIPLLMLFLARTGSRILDVQFVYVDTSGGLVCDSLTSCDTAKTKGVEITFRNGKSASEKRVYYFSVDLSDGGLLQKTPEFEKFISSLSPYRVYVKSASYLMHKEYFSRIRSTILLQSSSILQDDSGIPVKYFPDSLWEKKFYGTYLSPIPLFRNFSQPDMVMAYADSSKVKPLPFGIGYRYRKNESNLFLARKKKINS
jgi:hypothetical protein